MFSCYDAKYTRDRWTDGQTDGIGVAYTALSIASRGKNDPKF